MQNVRRVTRHWAVRAAVVFAAVVALLAALIGPAEGASGPAGYVALGDSYTAGPIIPVQQADPLGCLRSDHNYPHLVAPALGLPVFRDVSCSGAKTDDMTQPQDVTPGPPNPPQFNALDRNTKVVTLTIGGNDIGFTDIIRNCASPTPFGHPCQDHFVVNGQDQISQRIAAAAPKVAAVLRGIHKLSPRARIFYVAYLDIFPETGPGCWPQMPIAFDDVPYLRAKEHELNGMIATQAAANGAVYVDAFTASIGHDACQLPTPNRWVEPVVPVFPAAPVHPNQFGMQGTAAVVLASIRAQGSD